MGIYELMSLLTLLVKCFIHLRKYESKFNNVSGHFVLKHIRAISQGKKLSKGFLTYETNIIIVLF